MYVPFPPTITSVPDARDPETDNVPSVILVSPVYVFVPESVNVPEPECVKLPAPDTTPLRVTFDEPLLFKGLNLNLCYHQQIMLMQLYSSLYLDHHQ